MNEPQAQIAGEQPDPDQGHTREWPSTPYSDEVRAAVPPSETACSLALLGDCTVSCTYYPPANRPENHLAVRLRRAFPGQPCAIRNLAREGESADEFLQAERFEKAFRDIPRLDVAFVRYGINDRKRHGISGCLQNLEALCVAVNQRYPGVGLFIETSIWVDYPAHYLWDRNAALGPLYDAMRAFALEQGYPVVDIFAKMEAETKRGNWDLRVRGLPAPEHTIVDGSFDPFFGDDPAFFTNIHPNSRCLALIAEWQVEALRRRFGAALPMGRRK
ncbi:MAG TPA: GDSL-type esterase/lipase family protein [Chthonomonadaceae bacterium]|nr:GDSL-type esterase/lipase family protein [Chthonomonadaceae bacterium]